eukprot:CFRG6692T1
MMSLDGEVKEGLPKKSYLQCGLFGDQRVGKKLSSKSRRSNNNSNTTGQKSGNTPMFPLPLYHGLDYMHKITPFVLPYDFHWMYMNDLLAPREFPPPPYVKIKRNIYVDVPKPTTTVKTIADENVCCCRPSLSTPSASGEPQLLGCGENCVNRSTYTECSPQTCPTGTLCTNQRFQQRKFVKDLQVYDTRTKGYGVRSKTNINRGDMIVEYVGEIITERECRRRMDTIYKDMSNFYFLHHTGTNVIDGCTNGGPARFINHSCSPNAHIEKWTVNGEVRVGIFATNYIPKGEEISYDYKYQVMGQGSAACKCGAPNCSGFLGERPKKIEQTIEQKPNAKRKNKATKKGGGPVVGSKDVTTVELSLPQQQKQQIREFTFARRRTLFLVRSINESKLVSSMCPSANIVNKYSLKGDIRNSVSSECTAVDGAEIIPCSSDHKQLVRVMRIMYNSVLKSARDECRPFMRLPSKKRYPDYYQMITNPICLVEIEQRINGGKYITVDDMQADFSLLVENTHKYNKTKSDIAKHASTVFACLLSARTEQETRIHEIMYGVWETPQRSNEGSAEEMSGSDDEHGSTVEVETVAVPKRGIRLRNNIHTLETDVIRCRCMINTYDGTMLQCAKCLVWQHTACVNVSEDNAQEEDYLCELCLKKPSIEDILTEHPFPNELEEANNTYFRCVTFNGTHFRQGMCVYVSHEEEGQRRSGRNDKREIVRIDYIWRTSMGAPQFSGSCYYRPWETRHKMNHKFGKQEVVKINNVVIRPVEDITGECVVMDPKSYAQGRVFGISETDTFFVEWRYTEESAGWKKIIKFDFPPYNKDLYSFNYYPESIPIKRYLMDGKVFIETVPVEKTSGKQRKTSVRETSKSQPPSIKLQSESRTKQLYKTKSNARNSGTTDTSRNVHGNEHAILPKSDVRTNPLVALVGTKRSALRLESNSFDPILSELFHKRDEELRKLAVNASFLLVGARKRKRFT